MCKERGGVMIGIHINCREKDYDELILNSVKTIETRNKPTLRKYIGKRVGIIRTGKGKACLVGYATIDKEIVYETERLFRGDYDKHRVDKGSSYDYKNGKYGYRLIDVDRCKPVDVSECKMIGRIGREI